MELADIFAWDIDFYWIFAVEMNSALCMKKYLDGKKIGNGHILALHSKPGSSIRPFYIVLLTDMPRISHRTAAVWKGAFTQPD